MLPASSAVFAIRDATGDALRGSHVIGGDPHEGSMLTTS